MRPMNKVIIFAYSFLCGPLVGFHFHLQFIHQVLQTVQILLVLLGLSNDYTARAAHYGRTFLCFS